MAYLLQLRHPHRHLDSSHSKHHHYPDSAVLGHQLADVQAAAAVDWQQRAQWAGLRAILTALDWAEALHALVG